VLPDSKTPLAGAPHEAHQPVVLVIDDETRLRQFLKAELVSESYRFCEAATGQDGLAEAAKHQPHIIILDLGLPDLDGLEIIRRLRKLTAVPIIVLSARGQEGDKIRALDLGANDYVIKPFGIGELLARMRAALRSVASIRPDQMEPLTLGTLHIDFKRRRASLGGTEIRLTPIEYKLLTTLARHAGNIVTHRQLLAEVWGPTYEDQTHYLRVFMLQLRRKLEPDPSRPRYLLTEPGVGYRLAVE
jgi:two-component system, OmpR family, KDP operon response regulator KdpE